MTAYDIPISVLGQSSTRLPSDGVAGSVAAPVKRQLGTLVVRLSTRVLVSKPRHIASSLTTATVSVRERL